MTKTEPKTRTTGQKVLLGIVFGAIAGAVGAIAGHLIGLSGETTQIVTTGAGTGVITYYLSDKRSSD